MLQGYVFTRVRWCTHPAASVLAAGPVALEHKGGCECVDRVRAVVGGGACSDSGDDVNKRGNSSSHCCLEKEVNWFKYNERRKSGGIVLSIRD